MKKRKLKISNTKPRKNLRVYRKNDSDEVDIISLGSDDTETTKEEEEVEATTETKSDSDTDFVEDTPSHMVDKRNRKQKKAREKGRVTSVSFKINLKEGSSKKKKPRKTAKKTKNKEKVKNNITGVLTSRMVPFQLVAILSSLTTIQKQQLTEIGFGSLVDFKIKYLPMKLAQELVDRLDAENCEMMVDGKLLKITKQNEHDILGFPMGRVKVKDFKRAEMGTNTLVLTWKMRYPNPKYIQVTGVREMIENQPQGGWNYKIDILLSIISIMCEEISCGIVNQRVLGSIDSEDDIRKLDWCGYLIECLKRSKKKWEKDNPNTL
uniref:uncharacterized protein LOC122602356 isoform X2 n=1 Tax=Erigeron canadensis TaxID=72917 RepID=UPI001CB8BE9D|nr:uncharacterized protein LOC122602356 isoform X2 [Erigeron canadensis]